MDESKQIVKLRLCEKDSSKKWIGADIRQTSKVEPIMTQAHFANLRKNLASQREIYTPAEL